MEIANKETVPHPRHLDMLFAHRSKVASVFRDVLGLHEISHIAIAYVNNRQELLTFSSTPALEFNLFNSKLWRFDKTYHADWYQLGAQAHWETLYAQARYDELYYIKQLRHRYPLGLSLAAKLVDSHVIYSIASHKECQHTKDLFTYQHENFYKIGQYCANTLLPLFLQSEQEFSPILQMQV